VDNQSAGRSGLSRLTPQEWAVAQLVRQALTNRQIGRQLFLSHHTVNFHLRNVFHKLGLASRVELAGLLATMDESRLVS
jgi:DNA-binding NarL/FixJ family response regulator